MDGVAVDANVVVAGLLSWHEHHDRAFPVLVAARSSGRGLILPLPALIESYSVMTRLPPPFRLAPEDAHGLLRSAFSERTAIVSLKGSAAWVLLDALPAAGVAGGATYDAHILACARSAGAARLVTFNRKRYEKLDLGGIELVIP